MSFTLSPGVNVTEIDLTNVIPAVSSTDGALAGDFRWGPCDEIALVTSENELVNNYGKPDTDNAAVWFTAASFLAYGNKLRLVRSINDAAAKNAGVGGQILIKNDTEFEQLTALPDGIGCAKYPGALGNGLKVSVCPSALAFRKSGLVQVTTELDGDNVKLVVLDDVAPGASPSTNLDNWASVGSVVTNTATGQRRTITQILGGQVAYIDSQFTNPSTGAKVHLTAGTSVSIQWEYFEVVGAAPGTSPYVEKVTGQADLNDEIHVVVVDGAGVFTGLRGQVLERYQFASKSVGAKTEDGSVNYWPELVNRGSKYVKILDNSFATNLDGAYEHLKADSLSHKFVVDGSTLHPCFSVTESFSAGADDAPTDGDLMISYGKFDNAEVVDVALVLTADYNSNVSRWIINNICEVRKDCIALISPQMSSVVNNPLPLLDVIGDREALQISSSYAVMDANWKYTYDKYNDVYRWVPLNGDVAGLCVRTDNDRAPWWSPAGLNRGQIKNLVKIAYNPNMAQRDDLYKAGINPVISIPGQGVVLYGDKTLLGKPSAFDRINVRRLFIVLEKAIALAARFFLFEFNDEFTRQQFVSLVEPYLRSVKAGRGVYDYKVVCDESNNTGEVIDHNQFVGDIYIKPARSINFIQLNFVAVRTGVAFEEVVGKF